jgi:hypothetical protein
MKFGFIVHPLDAGQLEAFSQERDVPVRVFDPRPLLSIVARLDGVARLNGLTRRRLHETRFGS